jgi:hypothetical protein
MGFSSPKLTKNHPLAQFEPKSVAQTTPKSVAQNEPE